MDEGDKSWMNLPRWHTDYINGVVKFLDMAFSKVARGNEICCPCKKCHFRYWYRRNVVYDHLISIGFALGYDEWYLHGEKSSTRMEVDHYTDVDQNFMNDDIDRLLHDTFRDVSDGFQSCEGIRDGLNEEAKKFFRLVEEGKQELYPGCQTFTKLSFTIRLFLLKCQHGISNAAFTNLLELLREAFPEAKIPKTFNAAKRMVKDLGLEYEKIHACPNDCMLFWGENVAATSCKSCGASRWKLNEIQQGSNEAHDSVTISQIPAKVLRYFPLKPRLQRLFMCQKLAGCMTWHANERPKDGYLRHPADAQNWKDFDSKYPDFAQDPRNIRLGLATDGFNPFRTMSITHSTWPIVLFNYNLAPWNCMKSEFMILSSIIPGPTSPGKDIDVYMQPLMKELRELWDEGIETYDASTKQSFQLHAALLGTTSDFPGFAMLSGWSTKGKLACPTCHYETRSQYLKYSRKTCYLHHRRFLDLDHPWRRDKKAFNGHMELDVPTDPLSGSEVLELLENFTNEFGKSRKKSKTSSDNPWRKKSIFFDLPYWKHVSCRHRLDLMHIEKNVCDSILGTLLDIPGKTKDHLNARCDLQEMGIRKELHPMKANNDRHVLLAKACFSMNNDEKLLFCSVLKNAKLPQGYASNIGRCVDLGAKKISGYKSHDAHFILHYLLQCAVKKTLPKHVAIPLIRLGDFFRGLCSKVIKPQDLDHLQHEIVEILCQFERIFPPCFFDIMVHLTVHLVNEIKLGGPVYYWWMYPMERKLGSLKSFVRNKSKPEGSMAEGYLVEECLTFCARYMHEGVNTQYSKYSGINSFDDSSSLFPNMGHPLGGRSQRKGKPFSWNIDDYKIAHRYILFNCENDEVKKYIDDHESSLQTRGKRNRWSEAQNHSKNFPSWFEQKILQSNVAVPNDIRWLSKGPNTIAKRYIGYFINGYKFYTRKRDAKCKTQNSGVTLTAKTSSFASSRDQNPIITDVSYYGAVEEIIEVDYCGCFSVVLFRCSWFQEEKDDYGLLRVNFNKLCYADDPFVMVTQVHQVFYVEDPIEKGCHYVLKKLPRDFFDVIEERDNNIHDNFWGEVNDLTTHSFEIEDDMNYNLSREDLPRTSVEIPLNRHVEPNDEEIEDDSDFDDTNTDWIVDND